MTRLGWAAERLLEVLWLAAITFTPIYFNVYSSRVFEPDKAALLRTIALLAAGCWLVIVIERRSYHPPVDEDDLLADAAKPEPESDASWRRWMAVPLILYLGWSAVSSVLGVDPQHSILGGYQRVHGLLTQFSYVLLALAMIYNLRTQAQIERLINFALATALPVALYGLLQANGADPLPWAGDVETRIASTFGNSTFLGNWLAMLLPLILYRLLTLWQQLGTPQESLDRDFLHTFAYLGAVGLQISVLWFALNQIAINQRPDFGLWFIMFGAVAIFWLLTFAYAAAPPLVVLTVVRLAATLGLLGSVVAALWLTRSVVPIAAGLIGATAFVAMAVARRWGGRGLSAIGLAVVILLIGYWPTLNATADYYLHQRASVQAKQYVWGSTLQLLGSDPRRLLIGYGPESLYVSINRFYDARLAYVELRNATPDRTTSALLDEVVNGGLIGFGLYLLLIGVFLALIWRNRRLDLLPLALAVSVLTHLIAVAPSVITVSSNLYFYASMVLGVAASRLPEVEAVVTAASSADSPLLKSVAGADVGWRGEGV